MTLAEQIDALLQQILLKAENQHELLLGRCQSDVKLTNTQEHILMLLSQESLTNSDLAKRLVVSQAAVTKAVKSLVKEGLLDVSKHTEDGRISQLRLTDKALPIAKEHSEHHEKTLRVYQDILLNFSEEDQDVLERFLKALSNGLEEA